MKHKIGNDTWNSLDPEQRTFLEEVDQQSASSTRVVARSLSGQATHREQIKANCLICTSFDRKSIRACTTVLCPFHRTRPFQVIRKRERHGTSRR